MYSDYIFKIDNPNWKYKGILFAEIDIPQVYEATKHLGGPLREKDYSMDPIGVMGMIWQTEDGINHFKCRLKFPSGTKQVFEDRYASYITVTEILQNIYGRLPMRKKKWYKNDDESIEGLVKIMEKSNMIEMQARYKDGEKY